jgi:hypothetical protein
MSDEDEVARAVEQFVEQAEEIYHEYDEGYLDPDAALSRLGDHIAELRDTQEGDEG